MTDAGCNVVDICYDGVTGVEKAKMLRPEVVTFDLILPRLSGLQMIATMKRFNTAHTFKAISAVTSRTRIAAAKTLGVRYYVLKPVDKDKLRKLAIQLVADWSTQNSVARGG